MTRPDPLQVRQRSTRQSRLDLHATLGRLSSEEEPWEHIDAGLLLDPAPGIRLRNSSQPVDIRSEKVHSDDPEGSERAPDPGIHIVHPVATVSIPDDFHIDHPFDAQMSGKLPAGPVSYTHLTLPTKRIV